MGLTSPSSSHSPTTQNDNHKLHVRDLNMYYYVSYLTLFISHLFIYPHPPSSSYFQYILAGLASYLIIYLTIIQVYTSSINNVYILYLISYFTTYHIYINSHQCINVIKKVINIIYLIKLIYVHYGQQ